MNHRLSYEDAPYPNYVFSETHPSRIAGIGRIFNLACASSATSLVLEIGCGAGLNLLSHAASLTTSNFIGIDPSPKHIAAAKELQAAAAITNIQFYNQSIEKFKDSSEQFDYIICHGVFSWIPSHIRHEILQFCFSRLKENGIAYISYNSNPGWHLQNIIRDFLRHHAQSAEDVSQLAPRSRELLSFARDLFPKSARPFLQTGIDHLLQVADNYLIHEYFSDENQAFYFTDFLDLCSQHGLVYLAESDLGSMIPREFEPAVQDKLMEYAQGSLSKLEQYCDFLRLRQFRKTLLCKQGCQLDRNLDVHRLRPLHAGATRSGDKQNYSSKASIKSDAFKKLETCFPSSLAVSEMLDSCGYQDSRSNLLEDIMLDNIELFDVPFSLATSDAKDFEVSPLARSLARFGNSIPNLKSDTVFVSDSIKATLSNSGHPGKEIFRSLCKLGLVRNR